MPGEVMPLPRSPSDGLPVDGFVRWLRTHRGAVAMAGLFAFAGPLTFFVGALSVMRSPSAGNTAALALWWSLFGAALWCLLLVAGHGGERLGERMPAPARGAVWLAAAAAAAALASLLTAGRATILIEQGLVHSAAAMHLHGFIFALMMALLFFAYLRRSREHRRASARLASAQAAQRHARRRIVEARLHELQARIDPQLLFDLLDAVRRRYRCDPATAERFLDDLIAFLRTALPRLRSGSSSLAREAELARGYLRLQGAAEGSGAELSIDVAADAIHARFPPGVLLPLLYGGGGGRLRAERAGERCRVILTPAAPPPASLAHVQALLADLYGSAAALRVEDGAAPVAIVEVPYEPA